MRLNGNDDYEPLCTLRMDDTFREHFPIAHAAYRKMLMETEGVNDAEADTIMSHSDILLELYYEEGRGFFAVETGMVGRVPLHSPYTGERMEEPGNGEAVLA